MSFVQNTSFVESRYCRSPEHQPPGGIVLTPGVHTWECPNCHERTTFSVPEINL